MIEAITEVEKIINWYFENARKQISIEQLIASRDRLAVWSFRLAQIAAECKGAYNSSYFIRKVNVARRAQQLTNKSLSYNKAEAQSIVENESFYKDEIEKESAAYQADILIRQVNRILDAMSQRASHLKQEKEILKVIQHERQIG